MSGLSPRRRISDRKGKLVRRYQDQRSHRISLMSEPKKLICLISNGCHDRTQSSNQSKSMDWLNSWRVPYTIIDGMDPKQRDIRNRLFNFSGVRGNYPQFFFEFQDGTIDFLGNFERIEILNETAGLPQNVLARHPEIETWDKMFGSVVESFD
mmetsp:Transcript_12120/g.21003  ORF Transcript_12120/g.21003 Transcript_12120/m.21003 type:complete len:153 (-) Transcript_12120:1407-1865(-)